MSEHQAVSPAPVAQRENAKVAIWLFLGSEVIFFGALILKRFDLRRKVPLNTV